MIYQSLKTLALIALAAFSTACVSTSTLHSRESLALSADFKEITPKTAEQKEMLKKLPNDKLSKISHEGKTYYVLPDKHDNKVFVGGPKQYAAYQQLGQAQQVANEANADVQAEHQADLNAVQWGDWEGWDLWGDDGRSALGTTRALNGWY